MLSKSSANSSKEILEGLFSAWSGLDESAKRAVLRDLKFGAAPVPTPGGVPEKGEAEPDAEPVVRSVGMDLRYQYFYYYPYINWNLDRTPETNDYWVGLFEVGAKDTDYIAYDWVNKTTTGSYYVGEVKRDYSGNGKQERFELRVFNGGYRRKSAVTNVMTGRAFSTDTYDPLTSAGMPAEKGLDEDPFVATLEQFDKAKIAASQGRRSTHATDEIRRCWAQFDRGEQQLIYPLLEEDVLPIALTAPEVRKAGPEPKELFPELGKDMDESSLSSDAPSKIVLTITLYYSYTYVYPRLLVSQDAGGRWGFAGLYPAQRDVSFDPDKSLAWQWCGDGYGGAAYDFDYQKAEAEGHLENEYVGACFTWDAGQSRYRQFGLTYASITAGISASPAEPLPEHEIKFDIPAAIRQAKLSQLAYESYKNVGEMLPQYGLRPEMEIKDNTTGTAGFIASDDAEIVVVFRGTEVTSARDWLTDAWFNLAVVNAGVKQVYAHSGFVWALDSVYASIEAKLQNILGSKRLVIAGHSLGGALASITSFKLAEKFPSSNRVLFTFGCPPVGDIDFAESFATSNTSTVMMPGDIFGDTLVQNLLPKLGQWVNLYLPETVYYLPKNVGITGHFISKYIEQLEALR